MCISAYESEDDKNSALEDEDAPLVINANCTSIAEGIAYIQ